MDKINILVVEDTAKERDALLKVLHENNYNVVGVATSHKEALELFYANKVDIAIIDIYLNGVPEGITFAETLNVLPNLAKPFVFLTSTTDRTTFERAKLTKPFSYLLKPFNELELLYALELAVEKFYAQNDVFLGDEEDTVISAEYLFIKKGKSLKKVQITDIVYIEVEEKYCNIVTDKEKFVILISLTKILDLLDPNTFCRTHRNYIVNTSKIMEIVPTDNLVILAGNHKITLSDKYKDLMKKVRTLK
ncbi:Two-component system response regulatory protein, LytTR family [Flavobacterium indicum GPTSA100-9 = DSM 17447]|uniref:Two-component system response regulatory protein, LytTR family n=1 Tax=Flavobacterium indicum (strain DSM 17447 / CIP 109464 / GPTSA100-9) TaxID=1094466 RepID=H8XPY7_FLAIG|nr:response regulator transcription factor [Flavobacterium indicum]CCG54203.1 Two-component system response regulatory protein, LytTR family [Flavobacterium indicum GPTSA100-9 = DSM 17447]